VVGGAGVLLVLRVARRAVFLLAGLFACWVLPWVRLCAQLQERGRGGRTELALGDAVLDAAPLIGLGHVGPVVRLLRLGRGRLVFPGAGPVAGAGGRVPGGS
jgi:hypothetical protein